LRSEKRSTSEPTGRLGSRHLGGGSRKREEAHYRKGGEGRKLGQGRQRLGAFGSGRWGIYKAQVVGGVRCAVKLPRSRLAVLARPPEENSPEPLET